MLKNKKLKHILSVLVLFLAFFICGNVKAGSVDCVYTGSSGNEQVRVTISDYYDDGTYRYYNTSVKYLTWGGKTINKTKVIKNFDDEMWDLWIYKEKKCPPYLYGSADDGSGAFNVKNVADAFFRLKTGFTYQYDHEELRANAKMLSLDSSQSSNASAFSSLLRPRVLAYTTSYSYLQNSYAYDVSTSSNIKFNSSTFNSIESLDAPSIGLKTNEYALVYVRGIDTVARTGADFSDATITCTSSHPNSLEIIEGPSKINWTSASTSYPYQNYTYHNPGFTIKVKGKQVKENVTISCSATNPDGTKVMTSDISHIYFNISGSTDAQKNYKKEKINCYYKLQSTDKSGNAYDITDIKISVGKFNDGEIDYDDNNNQMQVNYYYMNTSSSYTVAYKGDKITNYRYYATSNNNQRKLIFNFTTSSFIDYLIANNSTCPTIYIDKTSGKYNLKLTSGSTEGEAFLYKVETKGSNDTSFKPENYSMNDKTFSLPVYFYESEPVNTSSPDITGAVTFRLQSDNLIYDLEITNKKGELKKIITNTMIASTSQRTDIYTSQYGSGDIYSYLYYVRLEPSFLQSVQKYLKGTISEMPAAKTLTDRVQDSGFQLKEYYTVSLGEITPEGNNYSEVIETDQYFEGTRDDTGVTPDAITNAVANIGSFNIGAEGSKQTPAEFCTSLLGDPGSRNGVGKIVETILTLIRIGVPILLIITSMVDFTKATGKDDEMVKAKKNAVTRFIVAVAVLFAPSLVNLVLGLLGWDSCAIF